MKKIGDISKHQPTSLINWPVFGKQFDLLFLRVQYGSTGPDKEYVNHATNCVEHGVPFYSYAFPRFVSFADAVVEATNAVKRQHAKSLGMVLDIEFERDRKGNPTGISTLSKGVRLEAIKAFVAQCRKLGVKRVGAYVGHNIYEDWGIENVVGLFDFVWIPRYGPNKPAYPCHIWQHTESGKVEGYSGNVDLNTLVGDKSLDWFIGNPDAPVSGILRQGDSGADVKQLQIRLTEAGYPCGTADGKFGAQTENALRKFQAANGLVADGIYGPNTKAKLEPAPTPPTSEWKVVKVVSAKYGLYSEPLTKWREAADKYIGWTFVVRRKQTVKDGLWYELYIGDNSYGWISATLTEDVPFKWGVAKEDTVGYLHADLKAVNGTIPKGSKIAILDEQDDKYLVISANQPQWVPKNIVNL